MTENRLVTEHLFEIVFLNDPPVGNIVLVVRGKAPVERGCAVCQIENSEDKEEKRPTLHYRTEKRPEAGIELHIPDSESGSF